MFNGGIQGPKPNFTGLDGEDLINDPEPENDALLDTDGTTFIQTSSGFYILLV